MPSSAAMGTYIYCVAHAAPLINTQTRLQAEAIGGSAHSLRILSADDLAAVVSDVPAGRLRVKRELLAAHEAVVLETMKYSDVIPLSFGAVAQSDEVVERLLQDAAFDLRQQLEAVAGCVELDLKALWNRKRLFEEIVAEDEGIRAWRSALAAPPISEQIALGELTSEIIATKSDQEAQAILNQLAPLAVGVRLNQPFTDMMALNAAFLVERSGLEVFGAQVSEIAAAAEDRLILRYSGPVPPYHFINLSLSWEDGGYGLIE